MNMKNLVIKTAYETIKEALLNWGLDNDDKGNDFSNYVYGITEVTDALIVKLDNKEGE